MTPHTSGRRASSPVTMTAAAVLTGLALLVTACTNSSSSGGSDSAGSGSSSGSGSGSGSGSSAGGGADADAALKLRQCLRKQGLDVPDPKPGEDPRGMTLGGGSNADPQKFQKALEACGSGPKGGAGGPTQKEKDDQLKWVRCMRDNGIDLPDPSYEGGMTKATEIPKGQEEAFKKAMEKCNAGRP
ncbi:hypothetical protein ACIQUQ_15180 [Streptomyces sp. NPDC101118]|uniref:hypothetical protein n=1 Tax=Streptomyces sp. NPDC101118 TaxID=3366109 RepID=UPI003820CEE5